ncbi:MAG TPA: hypothetical protein VK701_00460 [Solirubrobacteraceae bacterium]|jgi:hypothetical protein|nr:hypothetical protein [Solirubrobacteraceae bacterium]
MNIFGNSTDRRSGDNDRVNGLVRWVGRALLWGCILLLLVRGLITTLGLGATHVVTTTRAVGTQFTPAPAPSTEGK